jgi:hypothetical protein
MFWYNIVVLLVAYILLPLIYILARGYIVVEVFRTLAFLPTEAFAATFTSEIPHLA